MGGAPLPPFAVLCRLAFAILAVLIPRTAVSQAVPRTDTPRAGELRAFFEPVITTWDHEFVDHQRQPIGAVLPSPVFVRAERRVTTFGAEFGLTNRIGLAIRIPLVRVYTRESYSVDTASHPDSAGRALDSLLTDSVYAFAPLMNTPRRLRYFSGDAEIEGKYRLVVMTNYALSAALVVRLPTGHQDSPNRLFDIPSGDHQTDLEARVAQEWTVAHRLWLNTSLRLGRQQQGTRERRVGAESTLLIPCAATALLDWKPGDYVAVDIAPMYRFAEMFGAGVTLGYWSKKRDHYAYRNPADSVAVAGAWGVDLPAAVLDPGTSQRWVRLGVALTFVGRDVEGSFSVEQTVSGAGGQIPAATVFRIVMKTSRSPF